MLRTLISAALLLLGAASAFAQYLAVRGSVPLTPRQDVAVSGNSAVAVGQNSLAIINFANPSSPAVVGQVAPGVGTISGVTVRGNYAYGAGQTNGVVVVDISTPSAPDWVRNVQAAAPIVDVAAGDTFLAAATGLNVTLFGLSNPDNPHLLTAYGRAANKIEIDAAARKIHCAGLTGAFELTWTINQGNVSLSETDNFGSAEYTSVGLGDSYVSFAQNLQFTSLHQSNYTLAGQYGAAAQIRGIASGDNFSVIGLSTGSVEYLYQTGNTPQFASSAQAPASVNAVAVSANEQYVLVGTASGVTVMENSPLSGEEPPLLPTSFTLGAYPNPFNGTTTVTWQTPLRAPAELRVFDVLGRMVTSQALSTSSTQVSLNFAGHSAGNYLIELAAPDAAPQSVRVLYLP